MHQQQQQQALLQQQQLAMQQHMAAQEAARAAQAPAHAQPQAHMQPDQGSQVHQEVQQQQQQQQPDLPPPDMGEAPQGQPQMAAHLGHPGMHGPDGVPMSQAEVEAVMAAQQVGTVRLCSSWLQMPAQLLARLLHGLCKPLAASAINL